GLRRPKTFALLVYRARSPKRARTRQHLIGMLWGDKSDDKARRSLNEALRELRRSTGDGSLESDNAQVRVTPDAVQLDIDRLEALAAAGDYAGAADLVHGEFLEGFSVPGASEFETWLAAEREHWRRRSVEVLVRRAEQLLANGNLTVANDMVRRARGLDWRPETAVRVGLRGLALAGDRAGALALFEEFTARLRRELGGWPGSSRRVPGWTVRWSWGCGPSRRTARTRGVACSASRAVGCSRPRASPALGPVRSISCVGGRPPTRPDAPCRRCCRPSRKSSRCSCSLTTPSGSIGSPFWPWGPPPATSPARPPSASSPQPPNRRVPSWMSCARASGGSSPA